PEAMQAAGQVEDADDRRDVGPVTRYHPLDQSEVPEEDESKQADPGKDEPGQQRIAALQLQDRRHNGGFTHAGDSLRRPRCDSRSLSRDTAYGLGSGPEAGWAMCPSSTPRGPPCLPMAPGAPSMISPFQ